MTIQEIIDSDKEMLIPKDIAPILGCDAQAIRTAAKENPHGLGFSAAVIGTRTIIPRRAFLKFLGIDI